MDKFTTYLEELLLFMAKDIEQNKSSIQNTHFYFSFSNKKEYFTHNEGEDLQRFKKIFNLMDDDLLKEVLLYALDKNYIKRSYINGKGFDHIILTEKGFQKSNTIKLHKIISA